ncbi:hypothetical protein PALB_8960 [Pseudoalteromonas luteoviolacea B = ATCC 29581]|nr:hypothetical protein PALB_8960 [Pseudoalteromonas luteoviolacea B = ATCC 29581]
MKKSIKIGSIVMSAMIGVFVLLGSIWYGFFALKNYEVSAKELQQAYFVAETIPDVTLSPVNQQSWDIAFKSFDNAVVNGRLVLPNKAQANERYPVLIALHGMGRAHVRWWHESYKERPTLEQTDKLTQLALSKGYAVIALDARNHGERKTLDHTIKDVMIELKIWGERDPYEAMIRDTVKDYRMLLNWLDTDLRFDPAHTAISGYSMGGQMSLLLSALDGRVEQTLAIVPPHIGQGTAIVSPLNVASSLTGKVWLVSANDDEYATATQNQQLFERIATDNKKHVTFDGGHILPTGYYEQLKGWF